MRPAPPSEPRPAPAGSGCVVRSPAPGVHYLIRRTEQILAAFPVADLDREAAARLPAWRTPEYTASRTLLRALLAELGEPTAGWRIAAHDTGQPYVPERPELSVSLSHCAGWAAAAVARGRGVGVDVEAPAAVGEPMLRRCCTPADAARLIALPAADREREFAWMWTAKEACVKAVGRGLAGRPWAVPVAAGQESGVWERVAWSAPRATADVPASCAWTVHPGEEGGTDG
jgi:4'-phosphopantetheinyl transferase